MGVGTAIALAPLRSPVWMAKTAASIHLLSGGRFVLGVGVGGENADEFAAAGTRVTHRGAATDEAIDAVRGAWSGRLPGFSPLPQPPIPIWVGGRTDASLKRAAERGDGWLPIFLTPDRYREMWSRLEAMRAAAGRSGPFTRALTVWAAVGSDSGRAWDAALETTEREYAIERARFRRFLVAGNPPEVAQLLQSYIDAGADHIEIHPAHPVPLSQLEPLGEALRLLRA